MAGLLAVNIAAHPSGKLMLAGTPYKIDGVLLHRRLIRANGGVSLDAKRDHAFPAGQPSAGGFPSEPLGLLKCSFSSCKPQ